MLQVIQQQTWVWFRQKESSPCAGCRRRRCRCCCHHPLWQNLDSLPLPLALPLSRLAVASCELPQCCHGCLAKESWPVQDSLFQLLLILCSARSLSQTLLPVCLFCFGRLLLPAAPCCGGAGCGCHSCWRCCYCTAEATAEFSRKIYIRRSFSVHRTTFAPSSQLRNQPLCLVLEHLNAPAAVASVPRILVIQLKRKMKTMMRKRMLMRTMTAPTSAAVQHAET
mmetsp:Transcript_23307/g.45958  ORF Transcript_23307/g.45958 Transcript_23307/m.45958 type:complete len:224 (+) Transcript_23307:2019-2690(+)